MSNADSPRLETRPALAFHFYTLPLNMALGSSGLLTTLIALALGASVRDIGVMTAAGAAATIVFSTLWGRLSDLAGMRRRYLVIFFTVLGPIFLAMSVATIVLQLILLYTLLAVFTSGITPIATMYTVENCRAKNWQAEVARFNSMSSLGTILGLAVNTGAALFLKTSWLFYISAAMCFLAAAILWKTGREPEITLERRFFPVTLHDAERLLSPRPIFNYLRMAPLRFPKNLRRLKQLKPLQILFLACLIHWIGVYFFIVGQTPSDERSQAIRQYAIGYQRCYKRSGCLFVRSHRSAFPVKPEQIYPHGRNSPRLLDILLCSSSYSVFSLGSIHFHDRSRTLCSFQHSIPDRLASDHNFCSLTSSSRKRWNIARTALVCCRIG